MAVCKGCGKIVGCACVLREGLCGTCRKPVNQKQNDSAKINQLSKLQHPSLN